MCLVGSRAALLLLLQRRHTNTKRSMALPLDVRARCNSACSSVTGVCDGKSNAANCLFLRSTTWIFISCHSRSVSLERGSQALIRHKLEQRRQAATKRIPEGRAPTRGLSLRSRLEYGRSSGATRTRPRFLVSPTERAKCVSSGFAWHRAPPEERRCSSAFGRHRVQWALFSVACFPALSRTHEQRDVCASCRWRWRSGTHVELR